MEYQQTHSSLLPSLNGCLNLKSLIPCILDAVPVISGSLEVFVAKLGKKCGSLTLVSVLIPGKQEFFGLSDGLFHPVHRLGQPDGKATTAQGWYGCVRARA